jgi:hypothetical protein
MIDRHLGPGKEPTVTADVPVTHQEAAERIRAHLVSLRGGAPFLSPTDTALLVRWLDQGVPVSRILHGVEQAATQRRAQRRRVPLALQHAKTFVGNATGPVGLAADPTARPLDPLVATCHHLARTSPYAEQLTLLAGQLQVLSCDDLEQAAHLAISGIGHTFEEIWRALGTQGRQPYLDRAEEELADLLDLLGPDRLPAMLEEHARGLLRDDHPGLDATTVLQQVLP